MAKCPECGEEIRIKDDFCGSCGFNLKEYLAEQKQKKDIVKESKTEMKKRKPYGYIVGGIAGFIAIGLLLIFISGFISGGFSGITGYLVSPPTQNCRDVEVPYQEQEAYTVSVPYTAYVDKQISLKYRVESTEKSFTSSGLNYLTTGTVGVTNTDSETGVFTVSQTFRTLDDEQTYSSSYQIMPGETGYFYEVYDSDLGEDVELNYRVTPGTKTVTTPETRYRDETRYRTVTKYRTERQCD